MSDEAQPNTFVDGVAGASARREYERRQVRDEARTREKWGRLGGLAVALSDERQPTGAWRSGAAGELRVAKELEKIASSGIRVLHDRRIPGSRANIDHIVVTAGAIWVIDAKRYNNQRPELRIEGGILRPRVEKLIVGRRDHTKLIDGVLGQIDQVRSRIADAPVRGALCFVDADWPLFGGSFTTRDVTVVWPGKLARLLQKSTGDLDVEGIAREIGTIFVRA
jgi:hypothetical protein